MIPKTGGTFPSLLSIFWNVGYPGLYACLHPTLVMLVPNTVLYFMAYDEISMGLRRNHAVMNACGNSTDENSTTTKIEDDAKRQAYIPLISGSTSRLLASLARAPLELIRTQQASIVSHQIGQTPVPVP